MHLLLLAGLVLAGCARKRSARELAPAPLPELPAPAGLVAELSLAHPESTWRNLRALGSPASELLPASFPLLAGALLGLPALGASSLDQDVPLRGVVLLADGAPRGLLALHALDGRELVASLTTGSLPPFRAERDESSRVTFLVPTAAGAAATPSAVLAVLESYLLTGPDRQTVLDAGPYVVRTLAKRTAPRSDLELSIEQKPLHEQLVPALRARWGEYRRKLVELAEDERKAHADRAADFADPSAILLGSDAALESLFALLDGAERLELLLDVTSDRCVFTLSLTPAASGPTHELAAAPLGSDARLLLRLPEGTLLAIGVTRDEGARVAALSSAGDDWVRVLGDRLSPADAKIVRETLADWERGRGTSTQYGLLGGASLSAFVSTGVADRAALERAVQGFLRLLALPGVRQPLGRFVGVPKVTVGKQSANGVESAVLQFSARDKTHPALDPLELFWRIDGASARAAAGVHAQPALTALEAAAGGERALGAAPGLTDAVTRLGAQVALFGYLDARALGAEDVSPALVALGKRDGLPALELEISKGALAAVIRKLKER